MKEHWPLTIDFIRTDSPSVGFSEQPRRPDTTMGYDTVEVTFTRDECDGTMSDVVDEIERYERENLKVEGVVLGVEEYRRLWAIAYVQANGPAVKHVLRTGRDVNIPSKESVAELIGYDYDLVVVDGSCIKAIPADTLRLLHESAFEDPD